MMDEYTPTTERVRGAAIDFGYITEEEFDRWLAKVIAEAEERVKNEVYNAGYRHGWTNGSMWSGS